MVGKMVHVILTLSYFIHSLVLGVSGGDVIFNFVKSICQTPLNIAFSHGDHIRRI